MINQSFPIRVLIPPGKPGGDRARTKLVSVTGCAVVGEGRAQTYGVCSGETEGDGRACPCDVRVGIGEEKPFRVRLFELYGDNGARVMGRSIAGNVPSVYIYERVSAVGGGEETLRGTDGGEGSGGERGGNVSTASDCVDSHGVTV